LAIFVEIVSYLWVGINPFDGGSFVVHPSIFSRYSSKKRKAMSRRTRQRKLQPIADILARILKKAGVHVPVEDNRLRDAWKKTVGAMIAAQTSPDRIKGGTLFVKVSTSMWMHQLQFLKPDILEKIQSQWTAEPVKRLHFSVGDVVPATTAGEDKDFFHPTAALLKRRDKRMIDESLEEVKDPELQILLKRAMIKELARRRYLEHHGKSPG